MPSELLDIIDSENNVIGQAAREETHAKGLPHRIAAVLLETASTGSPQAADGAFLIMIGDDRLRFSASGHVGAGESYVGAAMRELKEETGMTAEEKDLQPLGSFWLPPNAGSRDSKASTRWEIFLAKYNVSMGPIVLNDEHEEDLWLDREELKTIYAEAPERISPVLKIALEKIFNFGAQQ